MKHVLTDEHGADDEADAADRRRDADLLPVLLVLDEDELRASDSLVAVHSEDGQNDAEDEGETDDLAGVHCYLNSGVDTGKSRTLENLFGFDRTRHKYALFYRNFLSTNYTLYTKSAQKSRGI